MLVVKIPKQFQNEEEALQSYDMSLVYNIECRGVAFELYC